MDFQVDKMDGIRVKCLIENMGRIRRPRCADAVRDAAKMQLSNPLWSRPGMWETCKGDIEAHCKSVSLQSSTPPPMAQVSTSQVPNTQRSVYYISQQLNMSQTAWDCIREVNIPKLSLAC